MEVYSFVSIGEFYFLTNVPIFIGFGLNLNLRKVPKSLSAPISFDLD